MYLTIYKTPCVIIKYALITIIKITFMHSIYIIYNRQNLALIEIWILRIKDRRFSQL